jgi:hypothetical protein
MRVPLTQGAYTARSVIAEAQRCVNLYGEKNPSDAEAPLTFYNTPGLSPLGTSPAAPGRGLYWANNGTLYYCAGSTLYSVSPSWVRTTLGTISSSSGLVSMSDNGTTMVLVDGTTRGYQVDLSTNDFSAISATDNAPPPLGGGVYAFYGATRCDIVDGYMLFNQPGTRNFYSTYNNEIVFDALYFAAKNGYSDNLVTVIVSRREIWLLGERTTEIWYDAGAADFPFQLLPGPFIQHGCAAAYSVAQVDGAVFWLSQDQAGTNILARGEGYQAKRISTHALEQEWSTYSTTADAQGFCFQFGGHSFYQINFPTANRSWRWDEATGIWHEPVYTDSNGTENRHRASCAAFAYGLNVMADWETGQLYSCSPNVYTDNGAPMYWRRGFPHMVQDGLQVIYPGFALDAEAATSANTVDQPGPFPLAVPVGVPIDAGVAASGILAGPAPVSNAPQVMLRWSDTRGRTWGQPLAQSLGATGQYLTQAQWNRLGRARDRVFEVYGVIPGRLAINGAYLDPAPIRMLS